MTNGRCVDDIALGPHKIFSSFESEANSVLCSLLSASKLVLRVGKSEQLIKK